MGTVYFLGDGVNILKLDYYSDSWTTLWVYKKAMNYIFLMDGTYSM